MNEILMVDGYDTPLGFDGHTKRRRKKSSHKRRRHGRKGHMTASKVCAGAKRRKLCLRVAGRGLRKR
jgi:hypothetical protein